MVAARRASLLTDLLEAARDPGAGPLATYTSVIVPCDRTARMPCPKTQP
jgi:ABC-type spermidine/putrescine transport system permease subunit I